MRKLLAVAALAVAAGSQAHASQRPLDAFYQGSFTCTVANATKLKLFLTVNGPQARAALRQYPYYGETKFERLSRTQAGFSNVSFRGPTGFITLRATGRTGVLQGTARIRHSRLLLTCVRG